MGGYAWSGSSDRRSTGFGNVTANSSDLAGGFGGGTIGYNWQMPGSAFVSVSKLMSPVRASATPKP